MFESAEAIVRYAAAATAERASEQIGLFGASGFQPPRLQVGRRAGLAADGAAERGAGGGRILSLLTSARHLRAEVKAA